MRTSINTCAKFHPTATVEKRNSLKMTVQTQILFFKKPQKSFDQSNAQWRIIKPSGSLLATDRSKAVVLVYFLLNVFGEGVSCRNLYSFLFLYM